MAPTEDQGWKWEPRGQPSTAEWRPPPAEGAEPVVPVALIIPETSVQAAPEAHRAAPRRPRGGARRGSLLLAAAAGAAIVLLVQGVAGLTGDTISTTTPKPARHPSQPFPTVGSSPTFHLVPPPTPTPPAKAHPAVPFATGRLLVLTGSDATLAGGSGGLALWGFDLATGHIELGPTIGLDGRTNFQADLSGVQMRLTDTDVWVLAPGPSPAFLPDQANSPSFLFRLSLSDPGTGGTDLQPVARATRFEALRDGDVAFVTGPSTAGPTRPQHLVEEVGTWDQNALVSIRYAATAPPTQELTGAYLLDGHLYASGLTTNDPRCFHLFENCSNNGLMPFVGLVGTNQVQKELTGYSVLGENPDGSTLLLRKESPGTAVWSDHPGPAYVWRPPIGPVPVLAGVPVQRIVAWSLDSHAVAFLGGRTGNTLYAWIDGGTPTRLPAAIGDLPAGNVSGPTYPLSGAWSGDHRFLFLVNGLSLFAYDALLRTTTQIALPEQAGALPVLSVVWQQVPGPRS